MKKILILLLICLIKISSSCQSNLNEKINIFTSSKIVNHSTLKDYYQFYDKKKKGYGLKTEKDTSPDFRKLLVIILNNLLKCLFLSGCNFCLSDFGCPRVVL